MSRDDHEHRGDPGGNRREADSRDRADSTDDSARPFGGGRLGGAASDYRRPRSEPFDEKAQSGYRAEPGEPDYGGYGLSPGRGGHKYDEFDPNAHQWRGEQPPSVTPGYGDGSPGASSAAPAADAAEPRDK